MPVEFGGEAVSIAVFLLNCAPTKSPDGMMSFEAWHGWKPAVNLRTFGCLAYIKEQQLHLRKLNDRSTPCVFIGYEHGAKAYNLYDLSTKRVRVLQDVIFDEDAGWS